MNKVYILLTAMLAGVSANAAYLYWQVNDESNVSGLDASVEYNAARVSIRNNSGATVWSSSVADVNTESYNYPVSNVNIINETSFSAWTGEGYSYYIELGTYAGSTFTGTAISQGETYSTLAASYFNPSDSLSPSELVSVKIWHGGTYSVPEPTSAMLMLFGAAFLGLKRKNRSIA